MSRNLLLLLTILILGGLIYFLKTNDEKAGLDDESTRNFNIENVDDISKIFIAQKGTESLTFTREKGSWLMNGKYKANQNAMDNILNFFKSNRIDFIPSKNATNNIVKEISMIGIKVEVYDKSDNLMKSFYIGGNTPNERGSYFLMEHAAQPYVLEVPSSVSVLRERFLRSFDDWRSYEVFEYDIEDLKRISVNYPKQKNHSFTIDIINGNKVEPYYPDAVKYFEGANQNIVDAYVEGYKVLYSQAVYNTYSLKDSISNLVPFASFEIEQKNNDIFTVNLFSFNDVLKPEYRSNPMNLQNVNQIEKFYASSSDDDFFVIQSNLVKKLLRSYAHFFEK